MANTMTVDELFRRLRNAVDCKSMVRKYLTEEMYLRLKNKRTKSGGTLADCIREGCVTLYNGSGIRVSDPDAYRVFSELINPIILDYHQVTSLCHPRTDFGDIGNLPFSTLDPSGEYIISSRVRVGRSHKEFDFYPLVNSKDLAAMERLTVDAISTLTGDLEGNYFSLSELTHEEIRKLQADHLLFSTNERTSGGYEDWSKHRGIFYNTDKTFIVWVNEEDHLRFISLERGSNLGSVYKRLAKAVTLLGERLRFSREDGMGYISACPTNLGTGLRASVLIKIPNLLATPGCKEFLLKNQLEMRGTNGYGTHVIDGVCDISNRRRLGLTEHEAVLEMAEGVRQIIAREKQLKRLA